MTATCTCPFPRVTCPCCDVDCVACLRARIATLEADLATRTAENECLRGGIKREVPGNTVEWCDTQWSAELLLLEREALRREFEKRTAERDRFKAALKAILPAGCVCNSGSVPCAFGIARRALRPLPATPAVQGEPKCTCEIFTQDDRGCPRHKGSAYRAWLEDNPRAVQGEQGTCDTQCGTNLHSSVFRNRWFCTPACRDAGKPLRRPPEPTPPADSDRIYPCDDCGMMRTKAEGGTTFTVCDACWDKHYGTAAAPLVGLRPARETLRHIADYCSIGAEHTAALRALADRIDAEMELARRTNDCGNALKLMERLDAPLERKP